MGTTGKVRRQWSGEGRGAAQVGGGVVLMYELMFDSESPKRPFSKPSIVPNILLSPTQFKLQAFTPRFQLLRKIVTFSLMVSTSVLPNSGPLASGHEQRRMRKYHCGVIA